MTIIDRWSILINNMMTPAQLIAWRHKNEYSQANLAEVLSVDVMTISRWERGVRGIPPFLHLTLECVGKKGGKKAAAVKGTTKTKRKRR